MANVTRVFSDGLYMVVVSGRRAELRFSRRGREKAERGEVFVEDGRPLLRGGRMLDLIPRRSLEAIEDAMADAAAQGWEP